MISAAIVGLGRWGKTIVEAVQGKSRRLRFVRGISKRPDVIGDFAALHGFDLSTEFADALTDPRVEAVFLATPHSLHVEQIVAVAAAGKAVWCEKPLALTRAEAERAVAACVKAGVVLGLGTDKRCFASMQKLKMIVAAGTIGEVLHVEGHFSNEQSTRFNGGRREDPRESPGGGMTGAGFHVLDAFVNLAGPIAAVDAKIFSQRPSPDPRDAVAALLQFERGATGLFATVRAAPLFWRVHVFGSKGWAEARDKTTLTVARIGETPDTQTLPQVDSLAVLLEAFAESVETGMPFPVSTVEMLDVANAFEAIVRSMEEGSPVLLRRN
jgi:predicted dehydrogenase